MALTPRQAILYKHTCEVWRATITIGGVVGKPSNKTWERVATGVKCYFKINQNTAEPQIEGRVQQDIILTQDFVHFDQTQDIQDADWLKNTTVGDNKFGQFWVVRGIPQLISDSGGRRAGYLSVKATFQEAPPVGVS